MGTEAIMYVGDLDAMTAFYREAIGLTPAQAGDGYSGLRADSSTLWLVRGRGSPDAATAGDERVRRRTEVPVKLAFEVGSLERVVKAIDSLGGSVAAKSWEFAGYRRRDAVDPEGNVLQLLELLSALE